VLLQIGFSCGLGLCLAILAVVVLAGRRERGRLLARIAESELAASEQVNAVRGEMAKIVARLEEVEQVKNPLLMWAAQPAAVNLSRRGQVLRLHRRGSSIPEIASALKLSQGEVKLIIRVHNACREPEPQAH
jgi:DNA-binding NarL/FixJ family response regulator